MQLTKIDNVNYWLKNFFIYIESNAISDAHIEPLASCYRIRLRQTTHLINYAQLDNDSALRLISCLKILSQLDISQSRIPQDGSFTFMQPKLDIRCSTYPVYYGEKIALRFQMTSATLTLDHLGLIPQQLAELKDLLLNSAGAIVVVGPTGSGKTRTLYSLVNELSPLKNNIVSIEDPIEIIIEGVNQAQIYPQIGLGFAELLKANLRQDPDVILLGEMRDNDSATIAFQAAQTGHLLLTSLHSHSVFSALDRLQALNVHPQTLCETLKVIIIQRLLKLCCKQCVSHKPCLTCTSQHQQKRIGIFELWQFNYDILSDYFTANRQALFKARTISLNQAAAYYLELGYTTAEAITECLN